MLSTAIASSVVIISFCFRSCFRWVISLGILITALLFLFLLFSFGDPFLTVLSSFLSFGFCQGNNWSSLLLATGISPSSSSVGPLWSCARSNKSAVRVDMGNNSSFSPSMSLWSWIMSASRSTSMVFWSSLSPMSSTFPKMFPFSVCGHSVPWAISVSDISALSDAEQSCLFSRTRLEAFTRGGVSGEWFVFLVEIRFGKEYSLPVGSEAANFDSRRFSFVSLDTSMAVHWSGEASFSELGLLSSLTWPCGANNQDTSYSVSLSVFLAFFSKADPLKLMLREPNCLLLHNHSLKVFCGIRHSCATLGGYMALYSCCACVGFSSSSKSSNSKSWKSAFLRHFFQCLISLTFFFIMASIVFRLPRSLYRWVNFFRLQASSFSLLLLPPTRIIFWLGRKFRTFSKNWSSAWFV